jgi:starvation-inducible DNA-binding protein
MAAIARPAHLPALGEPHQRDEVGQQLQALLVELIDLSLLGKQLHWSVTGPEFRSLHLQLDELVDSWRELADTVAERAVAIGFFPDGQSGAVAAATPLHALERGELEDVLVVRELTTRLAEAAERARERMDRLAELDAASQDVVTEVVRALEEQLWMIRTQLPRHHER